MSNDRPPPTNECNNTAEPASGQVDWAKKVDDVERERDKFRMMHGELKATSETTIGGLNERIDMMEMERERLEGQVKTFNKIQGAMTNMLFEVKHQAAGGQGEGKESTGAALKERQSLLRGSPMIVLDQLRSQVRLLLAKKDEYEGKLKQERDAAERMFNLELDGYRTEVNELRTFKDGAEAKHQDVLKLVAAEEDKTQLVVKESNSIVTAMKGDNYNLVTMVQDKQKEVEALERKIQAQQEVIEEQEAKVLEFGQVEDEHRKEMRELELREKKAVAQLSARMKELERENEILRQGVDDAEILKDQLLESKHHLHTFKQDLRLTKHADQQKKIDRQERLISSRDNKLKEQEKSIRHLVRVAETTTDANLQLEKEYKRVFSAAKKRQKEQQEQEERARRDIDEAKMAEQNPFYIDTYKKKLAAKEKEIENLKAKIRRMMVSENRGAMVQKTLQAERSRYEKEIATLRSRAMSKNPISSISANRKRAEGGRRPSSAMALTDLGLSTPGEGAAAQQENRELRRELDNMRSVSLQTKAALDELLQQHKALERSYNAEVHRPSSAKLQAFSPDPLK